MSVAPDFNRLAPLKSAFVMTLVIWSRSDLKSSFRADRLAESSDVSDAARAFSFIWLNRSVTVLPAASETSMVL